MITQLAQTKYAKAKKYVEVEYTKPTSAKAN